MPPENDSSRQQADADARALNCVVVLAPRGAAADALERIVPGAARGGYHVRSADRLALAVKPSARAVTLRSDESRDVILMGNLACERTPAAKALDWAIAALDAGRLDDLKMLQGVFAIVLVDWSARTATVVTDLLGMRPAYVARREGLTVLSDRAEASCRLGGGRVDPLALACWIYMNMIVGNRTMFESVERIAAASVTTFGGESPGGQTYWTPRVAEEPIALDDLIDAVYGDFERSLARLLEPYDAATSLLSGGFDSRLCLLTALHLGRVKLDAVTVPLSDGDRQVIGKLVEMTGVPWRRAEIRGSIWDEYESVWHYHPDGYPVTKNLTYLCVTRLGRPGPFVDGSNSDSVLRSLRAWPEEHPPDERTARQFVWKLHTRSRPDVFLRPGAAAELERRARQVADEQSDAMGFSSKFCLLWDICTDERRHTSLNHLQYSHLAPSVQPFYDRRLLERRLIHPHSVYTEEAYRTMLKRRFPGPGGLPHAGELPAGRSRVYRFSRTVWKRVPAALRFVHRHRDVLKQRWLLPRVGSYGLGRRSHMYVVLGLLRLMELEEDLNRCGIGLDLTGEGS